MRKVKALVLAICTSVLLSSCMYLPTSGSVKTAVVKSSESSRVLDLAAYGPVEGSSAEKIVKDFLRACYAGFSDDFEVARSFLIPSVAKQWNPYKKVRIFPSDTAPIVNTNSDGAIEVNYSSTGSVDENGSYSASQAGDQILLRFSLVKDPKDQWRIASLNDGVLLSSVLFNTIFVKNPIYYLSTDKQALVPDVRYYRRKNQATDMLEALLSEPSETLKNAVVSAIPKGARLLEKTVSIEDGVAKVYLSIPIRGVTQSDLQLIYEQVNSTLSAVSSVQSVQLEVNGQVVQDSGKNNLYTPDYDNFYIVKEGELLRQSSKNSEQLFPFTKIENVDISSVAIFPNSDSQYALKSVSNKLYYYHLGGQAKSVFSGEDISDPSYDRYGWIWLADRISGSVYAVNATGEIVTLKKPSDLRITKVVVSKDASRVIYIGEKNGRTQLYIAGVARDLYNKPLRVNSGVVLDTKNLAISDISWAGNTTVVALGKTEDSYESTKVYIIDLAGLVSSINAPSNAVKIIGGISGEDIYVLTEDGILYQRNSTIWKPIQKNINYATFSG